MVDTDMIGTGIGIAAIGVGTSIALGSMQDLIKTKKGKKQKGFCLKPIKIKW
jgi:hypothetical protein